MDMPPPTINENPNDRVPQAEVREHVANPEPTADIVFGAEHMGGGGGDTINPYALSEAEMTVERIETTTRIKEVVYDNEGVPKRLILESNSAIEEWAGGRVSVNVKLETGTHETQEGLVATLIPDGLDVSAEGLVLLDLIAKQEIKVSIDKTTIE